MSACSREESSSDGKRTFDDHLSIKSAVGVRNVSRIESDHVGSSVLHQSTGGSEGGLGD